MPSALPSPAVPLPSPGRSAQAWQALAGAVPGIALSGLLAAAAIGLASLGWLQAHGISALTLAIVLGMLLGNTLYPRLAPASGAGVSFAKQKLLRLGIILYGLRLTFQDIGHFGLAGVAIDALVLGSTFALSWFLGVRLFGMDRGTAMLIGAGSSICGAAAVMATEPVLRSRADQVTVAVSTVVVFGTLAIFLYPALYQWNAVHQLLPLSSTAYGTYVGSTIHEVAQVVAAGRAIDSTAADTAVIAKMVRVMMLAPFLVMLSIYLSRNADRREEDVHVRPDGRVHVRPDGRVHVQPDGRVHVQLDGRVHVQLDGRVHVQLDGRVHVQPDGRVHVQPDGRVQAPSDGRAPGRITIPWFALGFVAVAGLNSLALLPKAWVDVAIDIDTMLLATAMAALGLSTHLSAIRQAGLKPLALAALLFAWLVGGGAAINLGVGAWLN